MSEKPSWMPTDSEFREHDHRVSKLRLWSDALPIYEELVRGAVEKALAEQARTLAGLAGEAAERQEARHEREVLQAKIATLEEAARAVCQRCTSGEKLTEWSPHFGRKHAARNAWCSADAIHGLIAALDSEGRGGTCHKCGAPTERGRTVCGTWVCEDKAKGAALESRGGEG